MDYILIAVVSLLVSGLTFFSGFGLGTLLMPVFALFFSIETAISASAVVHLCNNIFKFFLIKKYINWNIVGLFGVPALIFSFLGAWALIGLSHFESLFSYELFNRTHHVEIIKIVISILIIFFALMDFYPEKFKWNFGKKALSAGGALSGFFGGLSGHQGALRSAFLLKYNLPKEIFVATGITIACLVDVGRLSIYGFSFMKTLSSSNHYVFIIIGIISAFIGSIVGKMLLPSMSMKFIHVLVGILLILISVLLGVGLI